MSEDKGFQPACIDESCERELDSMEAKLSKNSKKEIILVAYEKK